MGIILKIFAVISIGFAIAMFILGVLVGEGIGGPLVYLFSGVLVFAIGDNCSRLKRMEEVLQKIEKEKN